MEGVSSVYPIVVEETDKGEASADQNENSTMKEQLEAALKENAELKERISHSHHLSDGFGHLRVSTNMVYLLDLLDGKLEVEEAKLDEAMHFADEQEQTFTVYVSISDSSLHSYYFSKHTHNNRDTASWLMVRTCSNMSSG